jgi:hypothetical protein
LTDLFLLEQVPLCIYKPRLYLNGFPKAGLHLLELMMSELIGASRNGRDSTEWLGTFKWHSWTNEWQDMRRYLWRLSCLDRGNYLKGHSGHRQEIEYLMWYANIGHIFIYRDLRDVAVSQAHHILSDDPTLRHEHRDLFQMLGGFDPVLSAVIGGLGPYPGLLERWELYAPWLDVEWVMRVRFEELRADPEGCARSFLTYAIHNATHLLEERTGHILPTPETETELIRRMVEKSEQTHLSTTYRKGAVGDWREAFKDEHRDLFKQHDRAGWLVKLGYAENDDW